MRFALLLFLFTIALGGLVYWLVSPYLHHEEKPTLEPLITLLQTKSKKFYSHPYSLTHKDVLKNPSYTTTSYIYYTKNASGDAKRGYVKLKREVGDWEAYISENPIVCFSLFRTRLCAESKNTSLMNIFNTLEDAMPSPSWIEKRFVRRYEVISNSTALHSIAKKSARIMGEDCTLYTLRYSYKHLTPSELAKLNVPINSQLALADVREDICVNEEGLIAYSNISYNEGEREVVFMAFNSTHPNPIPPVENLTSPSRVARLAYEAAKVSNALSSCKDDACIRTLALDSNIPDICQYSSNLTLCVDAYLAFKPEAWHDVKEFLLSISREDLVDYFGNLLNTTTTNTTSS